MPASNSEYEILLYTNTDLVRDAARQTIDAHSSLTLAAESASRIDAVTKMKSYGVNLVLMDIGAQDAVRTLTRMRETQPQVPVILIGSLTFSNVRASMEALLVGAVEFVPTPTAHAANADQRSFDKRLMEILDGLSAYEGKAPADARKPEPRTAPPKHAPKPTPAALKLAPPGKKKPRVLLIGSSTGGPKAVTDVLQEIRKPFPLPILVTQHMPAGFTATFAANIHRRTGIETKEGEEGETVRPGCAYIAPGGKHMLLKEKNGRVSIVLDDGPPVNFCKPAVDPMFDSAVDAFDGEILALILTGMGHDGRDGARKVVDRGGTVIAQDAETSVVWGMPGAVAEAGLAAEILPLDKIAGRLTELCRL